MLSSVVTVGGHNGTLAALTDNIINLDDDWSGRLRIILSNYASKHEAKVTRIVAKDTLEAKLFAASIQPSPESTDIEINVDHLGIITSAGNADMTRTASTLPEQMSAALTSKKFSEAFGVTAADGATDGLFLNDDEEVSSRTHMCCLPVFLSWPSPPLAPPLCSHRVRSAESPAARRAACVRGGEEHWFDGECRSAGAR